MRIATLCTHGLTAVYDARRLSAAAFTGRARKPSTRPKKRCSTRTAKKRNYATDWTCSTLDVGGAVCACSSPRYGAFSSLIEQYSRQNLISLFDDSKKYPNSRIKALSNSKTQKLHIDGVAKRKGFKNLEVRLPQMLKLRRVELSSPSRARRHFPRVDLDMFAPLYPLAPAGLHR